MNCIFESLRRVILALLVAFCFSGSILADDADYNKTLKSYDGPVYPVLDLDHDLLCFYHTPEILKQKIQLIADCGFQRLYIIATPPGDAVYSGMLLPQDGPPNYLRQSREILGDDPVGLTVSLAKGIGLEVFIQYKPYEGGGVYTVPDVFTPPCDLNWLDSLGGRAVGLDSFIVKNPDMRLKRKDIDNKLCTAADTVEMVFVLDRIPGREGLKVTNGKMEIEQRPGFSALPSESISKYPATDFTLYTSDDNGGYQNYSGEIAVSEKIERRTIENANGELVFPTPVLCRVITLKGLELKSRYFAVKFEGNTDAFRTIPYSESCFSLYSGEVKLPITVSTRNRAGSWTGKYGFENNGFDFNEIGPYYWDCGWKKSVVFGFARGKAGYIRGSLCEAYPEVRQHWMSEIKRFIDMGCDGVDIRLQNHSSGIPDFANYGFNEPLIEAYKTKYGVDINTQPVDPIKMMRLRGEFFLEFVQDAANILHGNGKKLQMHMNDYLLYPTADPTFPSAGFWASPKVVPDWKKMLEIADEVTIKDYNWGVYDSYKSSLIKDAVVQAGKPLFVHCYMQQGHDLNEKFLKDVQNDSRITGLLLYEVVYRPGNVLDGIIDITKDGTVRIVPDSPVDKWLIKSPSPYHVGYD